MNLFEKITNLDNLEKAYIELNQKLDEKNSTYSYCGLDGSNMGDIQFNADDILKKCQTELLNFQKLMPVKCVYIPKKNGDLRDIYLYNIKDRIKAQALYRILEPIFEQSYSPFLFSYRSSSPSYYAARSTVRRYKRYFNKDYIGIIDITNYSFDIDQEILIKKIKDLNIETKVIELLKIFIKVQIFKDNKIATMKKGVLAGFPLCALFANIYLNDIDKYIGKKVAFYRRVGDDLIMFDKDKNKLQNIFNYSLKEISNLQLKIQDKKTKFIHSSEHYNFLGYKFENKQIKFNDKYIERLIANWSKIFLSSKPKNWQEKIKKLDKIIHNSEQTKNFNNRLIQIISQKILINDYQQIKYLNQQFFKILTKYFYDKYSEKNQRLLKKQLKSLKIPSLYKYYLQIQNGQKKLTNLAISSHKKRKKKKGYY